ncbi:hypothetical protein [Catenovulum maritimum]|uniref:hypothetical protein n=1 Tax=Catenovulum maritimum TaxID=1513271 RepID=UPI0006610CF1|nr:hypothetical protein [Catenovulum maritimum]
MPFNSLLKYAPLAATLTLVAACSNDNGASGPITTGVVVQTVAADYSSSEVVSVDLTTNTVETYYTKTDSDYTIDTYRNSIFHIGKRNLDTITKYNAATATTAEYQYSTLDSQSTTQNPYKLAVLNNTKAYLIRYGAETVWIVNPSAATYAEFKLGEIDLSVYNPTAAKQAPSASDAKIINGKLFISLQRLDENWATHDAYVAVFDTETDLEIETNSDANDNFKGIKLSGTNPLENSLTVYQDNLYIHTHDAYDGTIDTSLIERINANTYESQVVVSAADVQGNTSSNISGVAIVSNTEGYLTVTGSVYTPSYHEISSLYKFNPTTGEISNTKLANSGSEDINYIALDSFGQLWIAVANPDNPGLDLLNTATGELINQRISTDLNPNTIRFLSAF